MLIELTPLDKSFFRGPGEFDASSRGVYAMGRTLLYPLPTTVIGLLGWLVGDVNKLINRYASGKDVGWVDELRSLFDKSIVIRGPFIKIGSDLYVPYELKEQKFLYIGEIVESEGRYEYRMPRETKKGIYLVHGLLSSNKDYPDSDIQLIETRTQNRLGIRRENGMKTVTEEEGALFSVEYLHLDSVSVYLTGKYGSTSIIYDVFGIDDLDEGIYRFGGERTYAYLRTIEGSIFKDYKFDLKGDEMDFYVVSPILIPTGIKDISEYLNENISGIGCEVIKIAGRTRLLGAGYAGPIKRKITLQGIRRPIYEAILPGSILRIGIKSRCKNTLKHLYIKGLGVAREIGFGTIIPFENDSLEGEYYE